MGVLTRLTGYPGVRYGPITREQLIKKSIPLEKSGCLGPFPARSPFGLCVEPPQHLHHP
jgi:hypothetical protein